MGQSLYVNGLTWRFPGQRQPLFEIMALNLPAGFSLGIRGPSGAGKTTLFHCLSGIAAPTSGSICWDRTDLCSLSAGERDRWRHRQIGIVFQDFHLVDGLTALDNVLLPAHFDCWRIAPGLQRRAQQLLAKVDITHLGRDVALLSRGEKQRVALARALLFAPGIIIADEPTASLDPEHRAIVSRLLVDLSHEEGTTLIVVSHDEELLSQMDRQAVLDHGKLI